MRRDSRGDRYARPIDTAAAADRHGAVDNSVSGTRSTSRYGRYAGSRRSRSPRSGRRSASEDRGGDRHSRRRRSESDDRRRRRRRGASGRSRSRDANKREGRHRSRSRSFLSSADASKKGEGGLSRFEAVDMQELLQPDASMATPGTALPLPSEMIMQLIQQQQQLLQKQQQQQQQQATVAGNVVSALDVAPGVETAAPQAVTDMTNNLLHISDQDNSQEQEHLSEEKTEDVVAPKPVVPAKVLPSVEDFVPVIPKSLLNILGAPATDTSDTVGNGGGSGGVGAGANADAEKGEEQAGVLTTTTGALAVLQAPVLSPEAERRTREARRAHISNFPQRTTRQELLDYFTTIIPMVRRVKVQREMDLTTEQLRAEEGYEGVERHEIPPNAIVDVDQIVDISVNSSKSKPFAFLEVNLADIVTDLVEESQRDPERFVFIAADGQSHPITIRRPRDYQPMSGADHRKVVMLGFPSSLPVEKLRLVFEKFGPVLNFDLKAGMAYAEFEEEADAVDCVRDLHGVTLGNNVLVLMPLYDWLKVVCTQAGIDVALDPDDPVSGASLLAKDGRMDGSLVPVLAEDLKAEEPVDHMKELLELTVSLPDVVLHFSKTFPHLATLYGSTVPIFPSRVLLLMNLFDEEELVLDDTYERLMDEISSEVEKYGRVKSLIVPRRSPPPIPPKPPKSYFASHLRATKKNSGGGGGGGGNNSSSNGPGHHSYSINAHAYKEERGDYRDVNNDYNKDDNDVENDEANEMAQYERAKAEYLRAREEYTDRLMHPIHGGFGRVFVEYETTDEAVLAQRAIAGRLFGGRTVVTAFMFEDVLHPPTAEEVEAQADEKLRLYLEGVGAASDDEEAQEKRATPGVDATHEGAETGETAEGVEGFLD